MLGALALGAGIAATGGFVSSALNSWFQNRENRTMREREDNAISRRVRDLEAAGLSPTLAAGSPASAAGATAPNVGNGDSFDFMSKYLSLLQGRADVSKTNADTALAQMQATSEQFRQAFIRSQTEGEDLRNSWINADMMSTLGLRGKQSQKISEEIKQTIENTALLKAKTSYEQANTDFIKTQNDNEKIRQDILINDRTWRDYINGADVFNKYTGGNLLKTAFGGTIGLSGMLERYFPGLSFDKSKKQWFYPEGKSY